MIKPKVIVFGSINIDLIVNTSKLPLPGETILGENFTTMPGGKGGNQAVGLAKLGIETTLIGRVGGDDFGVTLLDSLKRNHVNTNSILIDKTATSGIAVITVDSLGENQIIVVPGANSNIDEKDILILEKILPISLYLLLQLEIPINFIIKAIELANKLDISVILDPAPVKELPDSIYSKVKIITPNAIEATQLVGFTVDSPKTAEKAATILQQKGVETVIITLGNQGVFCATVDDHFFIPPFQVKAIDTVAAGDAFNAGLTAALVEGYSLREAVVWGAAAGALSVTQRGAQSSLPHRNELLSFLNDNLPTIDN